MFLLFEHCADVMALCLIASSQHQPCHQHLLLHNRKTSTEEKHRAVALKNSAHYFNLCTNLSGLRRVSQMSTTRIVSEDS